MARRRRRPDSGVSGCVIIDKPSGCTSHDVVDQLRRTFGTRKVGHAGTLDPSATGVLVLGVGAGTKLLQFVTGVDKTYTTDIVFGVETSTLDADGEVTANHSMELTPGEVVEAASGLVGAIEQIPPMVSAIKVDGKRLHELAREGKEVERTPRPVTVHRFDTAPTDNPLVYTADISCSSGTYVRTLAADLGAALGGGAHIRNLRRTSVGPFTLAEAQDLEAPELSPLIDLVRALPLVEVDADGARRVSHGQKLAAPSDLAAGDAELGQKPRDKAREVAVVDADGRLLAVYRTAGSELVPAKVLAGT